MKKDIFSITEIENEKLLLKGRKLVIKKSDVVAIISKNQRKLLLCLMQEVNEKRDIINYIWSDKDTKSQERNYNQLVYQTRALLIRNGFPKDLIITIHRYGLCLNQQFLKTENSQYDSIIGICNDLMVGHSGMMDLTGYPPLKG